MTPASFAIGIDLGATRIKAIAVTAAGELLHSLRVATDDAADGWKAAVPDVIATIEAALGKAASIGISSPGLAARDHASITWMQGRLAATQGYDWSAALSRGHAVPVLNDAHAALLGEAWLGAARGENDVVLLTLGTGVGGAILAAGRLLEGHLGRAGHLGHLSLNPDGPLDIVNTPGSLEDQIGEHTLPARSNGRFQTTRQLLDAIDADDEAATQIWRKSIRALAAALASIINVVDPARVVIGGGVSQAGDKLFLPLRQEMNRLEWRPSGNTVAIVPALLGEWAGAYGAAKFAMSRCGK
ncbi:MAG TPA: ROK family protein [Tepidisphaeraceae bacterium]|jgi:glucokinase|nr:ROK family protein [Tepidisphaeraceae bacterium]